MRTAIVSFVAGALLLAAAHARAQAGAVVPSPWMSSTEQARLVERLRLALPAGWTVTGGAIGGAPDGWRSPDTRTFEIDGQHGAETFRMWWVPRDWIGIRLTPAPRLVYWDGALMDPEYKSITIAGTAAVYDAVRAATAGSTPSLINSGWDAGVAIFGDRFDEVDRQTQALVQAACRAPACRDEAAYSLILLGVPARTLTIDCAEHGAGGAQEACVSALSHWADAGSLRALDAVVSAPGTSAAARRYAAVAIRQLADQPSGPALAAGFRATPATERETSAAVADAIGRLHYRPAAGDILTRLQAESDRATQVTYARVLADLGDAAAVPAIEKLCSTTTVSADWMIERGNGGLAPLPEISLLRLTGSWSTSFEGLRLLLLAPEHPAAGGPVRVVALAENVADTDLEEVLDTPGMWVIDGADAPSLEPVAMIDGSTTLRVNAVEMRSVDLSSVLATPGSHIVQYRLLGATSRPLTILVPAERP